MTTTDQPPTIAATSLTGRGGHVWESAIGPDEHLIAPSYTGLRPFRSRTAVLMIDLYNQAFGSRPLDLAQAIAEEPSSCGRAAWDSLPYAREILERARELKIPVIYTVGDTSLSGGTRGAVAAVYRDSAATNRHAPDWANAVIANLSPLKEEPVIAKTRASTFAGTPLTSLLRAHGVDSLVVCGESTSGCVRASVVDAYSLGFDVLVAEEAVFDRSQLSHRVNLFDLNLKYATVAKTSVALDIMNRRQDVLLDVVA